MKPKLLLVEDDEDIRTQMKWALSNDYEVLAAGDPAGAVAAFMVNRPIVTLVDLGLPPRPNDPEEGLALISVLLTLNPLAKVVVVSGQGDKQNALRAIGAGAYDFLCKPVEMDELALVLQRCIYVAELEQEYRAIQQSRRPESFEDIIGASPQMEAVFTFVRKVAPTTAPVLILGESGTGKELVARAVHATSNRKSGKFVAINCAAIPEQLLESELFGYEKGAFTGAVKQTVGKIETADGGTLFLDEIGDMPLSLQAKLLRFLQDRKIERVGGRQEISVNVRIVCATNRDLQTLIREQLFRQDLYFRIGEVTIQVPPLRDRRGGAAVLAHALLRKFGAAHGRPKRGFSEGAVAALEAYSWPGNVRELENKVKTAVIMADGPLITALDLGLDEGADGGMLFNLREVRARAERQVITQVLAIVDNNISRAAELLGMTRPTLYDLMERYGLRSPGPK